jgi:hypothetical protein
VLVIICAALLATGLIGLLLLNTALAQGSFTLHDLRTTSDQLTDAKGALSQSLDTSKSPANLAKRAFSMGMVPAQSAAFLRLSDGKVIGVAQQASATPGPNVGVTPSAPASVVARRAIAASPPAAARQARPAPVTAVAKPVRSASAAATAVKPAKK